MENKKIELIIVGAQKAGTTSLNNYLRGHPDISGHKAVEFSFFTDQEEYEKGFHNAYNRYFEPKGKNTIVAKNVTITLNEKSLPRLKEHNPNIKLVFLLREPVSRAYSAYTMAVKDGWMIRPFSELKEIIKNEQYDDIMYRHFIGHGLYANQLETLLKYFPSNQIKIYLFEDLKENPKQICDDIFTWLKLPLYEIKEEVHNPTVKPRSQKFGGLLNRIRRNDNPIKRVVKSILPHSTFRDISNMLLNLNKTNKRFPKIDTEVKELLLQHFEENNKVLKRRLNQMEKHCLITYKSNNWLES